MATRIIGGPKVWSGERDADGWRTYKITYLIKGLADDGPATVMQTPGLPVVGTIWTPGNDVDVWAWVRPDMTVKQMTDDGDPNGFWTVELTASNKPLDRNHQRCHDNQTEDPLLEPPKISGGAVKYTESLAYDRFGVHITNSALQPVQGKEVEFDANRTQIRVEMNVPSQDWVALAVYLTDCVNDDWLWGFPPRCVKLSDVDWERKFYGQCYKYFTLKLVFDTNWKTFDRDLADEGDKALNGHWLQFARGGTGTGTGGELTWVLDPIGGVPPDPANPSHFIRVRDRQGEITRVLLDGRGRPAVNVGLKLKGVVLVTTSSSQYVEFETESAHGLHAGDHVRVRGARPPYFDSLYFVSTVPSPVKFTAARPIENMKLWEGGGYAYTVGNAAGVIHVEAYNQVSFAILGIPIVF